MLFLNEKELFRRFEYLGEGAGRRVFSINNDLVIKVAKGKFGVYQNSVENYIYEHASIGQKKYLCPVIWYNPDLIVMRKALPLNKTHLRINDLKTFCARDMFYNNLLTLAKTFLLSIADIKRSSSWGILNGRKVLIDYGLPNKEGFNYYNKVFNFRISLNELENLKLIKKIT